MSSAYRWSIAVVATLALAAPVSAQQKASGAADLAPFTSSLIISSPITSSVRATPPAFSLAPTTATESTVALFMALPQTPARQSENVAMMIVGGAAMIVGSVIGGDTGTIVMVGGGAVGLIGLFRYLR